MSQAKQKTKDKPLRSAKFLLALLALVFVFIIGFLFASSNSCKQGALLVLAEQTALAEFENIKNQLDWHIQREGVFGWSKNEPELGMLDENKAKKDGEPNLVKLPPCTIIREIAKYKNKSKDKNFRISSPHPLNLNNITNTFEQNSLLEFEKGKEFTSRKINTGSSQSLQFVFPLESQKSCLACHTAISATDKLLGTFSVTYKLDKWEKEAPSLTLHAIIVCLLLVISMGISAYLFTQKTYATKVTVKTTTQSTTADQLTGLLNRTALFEFLEREVMRAKRLDDNICLILIDIDHFKEINDRYGSKMGDAVLIFTSQTLEAQVREYDIIGRSGGNEFLLLLPQTPLNIAQEICKRLITIVHKTPVSHESDVAPVTVSVGLVELAKGETVNSLLSRASGALSNAKANGGDRLETDDVFRIKR